MNVPAIKKISPMFFPCLMPVIQPKNQMDKCGECAVFKYLN